MGTARVRMLRGRASRFGMVVQHAVAQDAQQIAVRPT